MHKKVLLINPSPGGSTGINEATIYPPLGLAYLASYLRKKATKNTYDIKIIDASMLNIPNEELIKIIAEYQPEVVGIHMNIILTGNGLELSKAVKEKHPRTLIALGGPTVSSNPEKTLKLSKADIAVLGEAEATFLEICEGKKREEIKGIAYIEKNKIVMTEPQPFIQDLDDIPHPAYDMLPDFKLYKSRARSMPAGAIITSRGCPYQCTFCDASVFGKKFRANSPEYVIEEIDMLIKKYGIKQLDILDDNFTLDMERADKILDLITQRGYKLNINIQNGVRVDRLNEELVKKMKKAGVFKVGIGIESANKQVLQSIKKGLDPEKVIQAISWFRKCGIITVGFFIIGFPDDTKETINESITFAIKANPSIANFMFLIPFPGTEIHEQLRQQNLLLEPERFYYPTGFYETRRYHRCKCLTEKELLELQRKAYAKFNFRISKAIETWTNIRSLSELRWVLKASFSILKYIFFKRKKEGIS